MKGIVGICVAVLIFILGLSFVAAPSNTARFASGLDAAFRILRPTCVLGLFAVWFPMGRWLHNIHRLSDGRYALWRKLWAPIMIWYVLIEIGIGQGKPLWALILACLYWGARFLLPKVLTDKPASLGVTSLEDKK